MRKPTKPPALFPGCKVIVVSPASPADPARLERGCHELIRLGYKPRLETSGTDPVGYFSGSIDNRRTELVEALQVEDGGAAFCARGGYGSNYLLDVLDLRRLSRPRILLGYSDITSLEILLWQKLGWVTFYGPMVAAGFDAGADVAGGYDAQSFSRAMTQAESGWMLDLRGASFNAGVAEGVLLGGCMTLVETSLGTPWELDTSGAILLLEDRGMKPYQVDRALMHLKQAGKLKNVRGIILGEFPESEPPIAGGPTVREVCQRILGELGVPLVWGAPVGHTSRPVLTLPLGVRARLRASGAGQLEILEPAVTP
ncbi:MAG: LD-carboxypeptidase [Acidobacteria bacterium]|nr:MAG: LD-carboxypeptidase [Acidobacteriota bacterium]